MVDRNELRELKARVRRLELIMANGNGALLPGMQCEEGSKDLIQIIQEIACRVWDISFPQLVSKSHVTTLLQARYAAMLLIYNRNFISTAAIGMRFGGRHHTSVCYGIQSARCWLENGNSDFKWLYFKAKDELCKYLNSRREFTYQI